MVKLTILIFLLIFNDRGYFMTLLLFLVGLVCVAKGGDVFVDGASWLGERSGIPKFIVGATIVSFATTLPELVVSVVAAVQGKTTMAVGNGIGTVMANTAIVMGVAVAVCPFYIRLKEYGGKFLLLLLGGVCLYLFSADGEISPSDSVFMLGIFIGFIVENIMFAQKINFHGKKGGVEFKASGEDGLVFGNVIKFVVGAVGIGVGGRLLVDYGSLIARDIGVSEGVIGLCVIGVGAALPEFVTMIVSVKKGESAMAVGNVIGANIIDIGVILPVCSIISGQSLLLSAQNIFIDLPVFLWLLIISVVPTVFSKKFSRWQGIVLGVVYICYVVFLFCA